MAEKRFYVTIEVTATTNGADLDKHELRRRIIQYIHNENQKQNNPYGSCYLHSENIVSINDEKGKEL